MTENTTEIQVSGVHNSHDTHTPAGVYRSAPLPQVFPTNINMRVDRITIESRSAFCNSLIRCMNDYGIIGAKAVTPEVYQAS